MDTQTRDQMLKAKALIQQKKYHTAYMLLKDVDHPTAGEWRVKLQERIEQEELGDPFSDDIVPSLSPKLKHTKRKSSMLNSAVNLFVQNNWEILSRMDGSAIVEKRRSPSVSASLILILLFSLVGMFIVLLGIATAKLERVTLEEYEDGSLFVSTRKGTFEAQSIASLQNIAKSVKDGATYGSTLAVGIGLFLLLLLVM